MANDTLISERELEILRLVATGASNQQIAQTLNISINTVKVHLRNIFSKIGVVSRTEATLYAINNGLVAVDAGAVQLAAAPSPRQEEPEIEPAATDPPAPPHVVAAPAPPRPARWALMALMALLLVGSLVIAVVVRGLGPAEPDTAPAASLAPASVTPAAEHQPLLVPMQTPRDDFALVSYEQEQKLYVIGGRDGTTTSANADRFDPASNLWVSLADKPVAVSDAQAITLRGKIYVPGGLDAAGQIRDILEFYDPREQRWGQAAPIPAARSRYTLVAWEGRLYLIGGWDGAQVRGEVFVYEPLSDTWSAGPGLTAPRQHAGAAIVSGRIYVIGGNNAQGALRDGSRLDPADDNPQWEGVAPLPNSIAAPAVLAPVSVLLVFDPERHQGFQYDSAVDAWESLLVADDVLLTSHAVLLGKSIYFIADTQSPSPGAVSKFQVIYSVFVPGTSGGAP